MSSGALIETDQESVPTLDLMLVDARAEVDLDTVSLMLNGNQIIGFARRGKTPTGLRLVVDRESVRHPHLALAEDNHLQFAAADMEGNRYRGEFDLRISDDVAGIRLVAAGVLSQPVLQEVAKPNASAPTIKLLADPEVVPDGNSWQLVAEVQDDSGIQAVVVLVNWKEYERVQLRNGFPSRQRQGRRKAGLPGSVTGDSHRLMLDIPVPLGKRLNSITLRATNSHGIEESTVVSIWRGDSK